MRRAVRHLKDGGDYPDAVYLAIESGPAVSPAVIGQQETTQTGSSALAIPPTSATEHLIRAQDKLLDLHPDPSGAYVEVILAVEAIACPIFLPRDPLPTLGKVRSHMQEAGDKYEYVLAGKTGAPGSTAGVVAMLADLWEGHSDRHAGGPTSTPVTQEAAEAAFTLAVSLVNLFAINAVRQQPNARVEQEANAGSAWPPATFG